MKHRINIGLLYLLGIPAGWAGNASMMQEAANRLIQLNEQVVKQLRDVGQDGQVTVKARIKEDRDGHQVIYLDQANTAITRSSSDPDVLAPTPGYTSYIRTGPIPTGERLEPASISGGGHAVQSIDRQDFQKLWDTHPQARIVELKGAAIEALDSGLQAKPKQSFLIYW